MFLKWSVFSHLKYTEGSLPLPKWINIQRYPKGDFQESKLTKILVRVLKSCLFTVQIHLSKKVKLFPAGGRSGDSLF